MKILVPVKQVAVLDEDFELREDGLDADPDFIDFDDSAKAGQRRVVLILCCSAVRSVPKSHLSPV